MARWGGRRWNYDIRDALRLTENLFDPKLEMKWRYRGSSSELSWKHGIIWRSNDFCSGWYEYPSSTCLAKLLLYHINTPLEQLKDERDQMNPIAIQVCYEPSLKHNWGRLAKILLAADRRVGKNYTGVWLFMETDQTILNILGSRN